MENALLSEGNIVVLDGFKNTQIVVRLTEELLSSDFIECVKKGYYKIREATILEKEFWFCAFDEEDCYAVPLSNLNNWVSRRNKNNII